MLDTSLGVHAGLAGSRRRGLCRRTSRTCRILGGASARTLGLVPGGGLSTDPGAGPGRGPWRLPSRASGAEGGGAPEPGKGSQVSEE